MTQVEILSAHHLCHIIQTTFRKIIEKNGFSEKEDISLNIGILQIVAESIQSDMKRLSFHKIILPDPHKHAGFSTKWIAKLRPVQTIKKNDKSPTIHFINENLALEVGFAFLGLRRRLNDKPLVFHLLYSLKYRDIQPETLALIYYQLERDIELRERLRTSQNKRMQGEGE